VLTPGRYVGAEAAEDDGEPFEGKMKRLATTLRDQQAEAAKLDAAIAATGKPEREFAEKYRAQAEAVEDAGYHRLATTLRELAASYERDAESVSSREHFTD